MKKEHDVMNVTNEDLNALRDCCDRSVLNNNCSIVFHINIKTAATAARAAVRQQQQQLTVIIPISIIVTTNQKAASRIEPS